MNEENIDDIKPPVDLPPDLTWLWWGLGILLVFVFGLLVWRFMVAKRKRSLVTMVVARSPWDKALEALKDLYAKGYPQQGLYKDFFDGVSDIVRFYLEERFAIHAPHMSTEEFLLSLQASTALTDAQKNTLKEMMYAADLVKFAKHQPSVNDCERFYQHAVALIGETHGV